MASSSQKFIARNRAPRVQIEYDVELYGAEKKVQLPFVMGVMSDLAGKSGVPQPAVEDRKFLEIDVDTFDDRMRAMAPRVSFAVPNTLTGEGNLSVDLTFANMKDFSPAAVAAKVEPLRALLEARTQLQNLLTYMDGKAGAEALIEKVLGDPSLLAALSSAPISDEAETGATLAGLAAAAPPDAPGVDATGEVLAGLREAVAEPQEEPDSSTDILANFAAGAPENEAPVDPTADVLSGLRDATPKAEAEPDTSADILADLAAGASEPQPEADTTGDVLSGLRDTTADEAEPAPDGADDILAGLAATPVEEAADEGADDVLSGLLDMGEAAEAEDDASDDILAGLAATPVEEAADEGADDVLSGLLDMGDAAEAEGDASDDILAGLAATPVEEAADEGADDVLSGLLDMGDAAEDAGDASDDILAGLAATPVEEAADEGADDVLSGLLDMGDAAEDAGDASDDILAGLAATPVEEAADEGADDVLSGLLDMGDAAEAEDDASDDILAGLAATPIEEAADEGLTDLDALLGGNAGAATEEAFSDLDALLGGDETGEEAPALAGSLDDLLADNPAGGVGDDALSDLDALLGGAAPADDAGEAAEADDLDALLSGSAGEDASDVSNDAGATLASADTAAADEPSVAASAGGRQVETPYGFVSAPRPDPESLRRTGFRMAFFGDFTGRAARGLIEPGEGLANRRVIALDVDTVEDVIAGFATDLVLPLGPEGRGVAVRLKDLDGLHPDELFDDVEIFQGLSGLRQRLKNASLAPAAMAELQKWGAAHGQPMAAPRRTSAGSSVPANLRLGAFQTLIGDTAGRLTQAAPVDDMIARIIGPHVVEAPNPDAQAMQGAVDAALSSAMRMILHHPEFQSVEALWRSLDFLARRVETDVKLTIDLFDVSAEELAVDLAAQDDMAESGFLRLLTERPLGEEGPGGYSALFGLYTFEETPPHAELLARIAQVAAHVDAPFFTAISPAFLEVAKEDRHPLVAKAWDELRALPEAQYLGLSSPRFMLRHPYGERSDPIDAFDFEEFTPEEGLSGMLWANPVLLVAVLLATGWKQHGKAMSLGSVMGIGDIPYHFVTDQHGDQVALPCTERNLTTSKVERVVSRGYQPVLSIRGRNEIRLGSFQSVGGGEIRGRWTGAPMPPRAPAQSMAKETPRPADIEMEIAVPTDQDTGTDTGSDDLDALLAGLDDTPAGDAGSDDLDALLAGLDDTPSDDGGLDDLDALLAGFDDTATPSEPGEMDDELAKLLEGL